MKEAKIRLADTHERYLELAREDSEPLFPEQEDRVERSCSARRGGSRVRRAQHFCRSREELKPNLLTVIGVGAT